MHSSSRPRIRVFAAAVTLLSILSSKASCDDASCVSRRDSLNGEWRNAFNLPTAWYSASLGDAIGQIRGTRLSAALDNRHVDELEIGEALIDSITKSAAEHASGNATIKASDAMLLAAMETLFEADITYAEHDFRFAANEEFLRADIVDGDPNGTNLTATVMMDGASGVYAHYSALYSQVDVHPLDDLQEGKISAVAFPVISEVPASMLPEIPEQATWEPATNSPDDTLVCSWQEYGVFTLHPQQPVRASYVPSVASHLTEHHRLLHFDCDDAAGFAVIIEIARPVDGRMRLSVVVLEEISKILPGSLEFENLHALAVPERTVVVNRIDSTTTPSFVVRASGPVEDVIEPAVENDPTAISEAPALPDPVSDDDDTRAGFIRVVMGVLAGAGALAVITFLLFQRYRRS